MLRSYLYNMSPYTRMIVHSETHSSSSWLRNGGSEGALKGDEEKKRGGRVSWENKTERLGEIRGI